MVDGVIAHAHERSLVQSFIDRGVPVVVKGIDQLPQEVAAIESDDDAIGRMAADHLLTLGFRSLAFCGYEEMYWSGRRLEGFKRRASDFDIEVSAFSGRRPAGECDRVTGFQNMMLWLKKIAKPVGVFACNDDRGQDVIHCALASGFSVPEEVAVVGVDNDELVCELAELPLTSIVVANEKAGFEAAALLDRMIGGDSAEGQRVVSDPLYIIQRLSTDTLAVDDWSVREALRFINAGLSEGLTVDGVAKQMCVSRRTAEIRFRKVTGRSINELIAERRIRVVSELLIETGLSVEAISQQAGFSSSGYLGTKFKEATGMTPTNYRNNYAM